MMQVAKCERLRVLLIEVDPGDSILLKRQLSRRSDMGIVHVWRLRSAFVALQREHFDAVVTDLGLPDAMGLAAVTRIRSQYPDLAIVVLSGATNPQLAVEALENGAQDYIQKRGGHRSLPESIAYAIERLQASRSHGAVIRLPLGEVRVVERSIVDDAGGQWGVMRTLRWFSADQPSKGESVPEVYNAKIRRTSFGRSVLKISSAASGSAVMASCFPAWFERSMDVNECLVSEMVARPWSARRLLLEEPLKWLTLSKSRRLLARSGFEMFLSQIGGVTPLWLVSALEVRGVILDALLCQEAERDPACAEMVRHLIVGLHQQQRHVIGVQGSEADSSTLFALGCDLILR